MTIVIRTNGWIHHRRRDAVPMWRIAIAIGIGIGIEMESFWIWIWTVGHCCSFRSRFRFLRLLLGGIV